MFLPWQATACLIQFNWLPEWSVHIIITAVDRAATSNLYNVFVGCIVAMHLNKQMWPKPAK